MTTDHTLRTSRVAARELSGHGVRQLLGAYQSHRHAVLDPDWTPQPGMLYTQVRAISARINQNYDAWPSEELKKSFRTFLGKPVFVNHANENPDLARGKVIAARYIEAGDDRYVEVIQEIDAQRFPKLAKEIREGGLDSVSMGVEAGLTKCSYCGNLATDEPEFCDHVKYHKGEYLPRRTKTGKVEDVLVFEHCYKLGFFELSYVFDPADETAVVSRVIAAGKTARNWEQIAEERDRQYRQKTERPGPIKRLLQEVPEELLSELERDRKLNDFKPKYKVHKELVHVGNRRRAYGEITAPEDIDTLRDEDGESFDDYQFVEPVQGHDDARQDQDDIPFQHWIESPEELQAPDLGQTKRLDREQESEGLDANRRVEDVEGIVPGQQQADMAPPRERQAMARYRYAESDEDLVEEAVEDLEAYEDAEGDEPDDVDTGEDDDEDPDDDGDYDDEDDESDDDEDEKDVGSTSDDDKDAPPWVHEGARYRSRPVGTSRSAGNGRRTQKGNSTMGDLAQRGKVASRGRRRHYADESGHVDGGPYGDDTDQGVQEEVYISQVPSAEAVQAPADDESNISNTPANLVAGLQREIKSRAADLQRYIQAYRKLADDNIIEPDKVDPPLSGTDVSDLKGDDFESVQPERVETQPKDASVKVFYAFDNWLRDTTGRTAAQHGNANYIRRQAASFAKAAGIPLERMFPTLDVVLRQTRMAEKTRSATMPQRRAEFDGEVVAPDARIDVEAPVKNVTDADAQASQYDLSDYGNNAGDNLADPDLETDSQIWAPEEGSAKSASRKADAVAAVRYAEAYISAGLPGDKWKLVAQAQTMRHATVVDRIRLLEAVAQTNVERARSLKVAAVGSRGTSNGIPHGLTAPRTASTQRVAADDSANDIGLWF